MYFFCPKTSAQCGNLRTDSKKALFFRAFNCFPDFSPENNVGKIKGSVVEVLLDLCLLCRLLCRLTSRQHPGSCKRPCVLGTRCLAHIKGGIAHCLAQRWLTWKTN